MARNITLDEVNYFVLRKQHLTDDSRIDDVIRLTRDIGGLHATDSVTPYLSLFARSSNFVKDSLDEELYLKKNLGKIRCMRSTLYILTRDMIPVAYAATNRIVEKNSKGYAEFRGVSSQQYEELSRTILQLLKGREFSVFEIKKALQTQIDMPSVLNLMCDQGLLVRGRREKGWRDKNHKYSIFREYFPDVKLTKYRESEAITLLLLQYLKSFGPVTENDMAWWTGLTKARVRQALSELKQQISRLEIAGLGGDFIALSSDLDALREPSHVKKRTLNLLPTLDPYLMGYRDRDRYLDTSKYDFIFDRSGNAAPAIMLDGRVIGVWDFEQHVEPTVKIHLFEKVAGDVMKEIRSKARRTGKFLAGKEAKLKECASMVRLRDRPAGAIMSPLRGC
jgi:DNA glycosylase AlkZ-like